MTIFTASLFCEREGTHEKKLGDFVILKLQTKHISTKHNAKLHYRFCSAALYSFTDIFLYLPIRLF